MLPAAEGMQPRGEKKLFRIAAPAVKGGIGEVDVLTVHPFLCKLDRLTETLKMHDLAFAEKTDHIGDVGVVREPENIVVGDAGFLFGGKVLGQICDDVARNLHSRGGPRIAGGKLGVYAGGMVDKIGVKACLTYLLCCQVPGQLMNNGRYDLHVTQFFCADCGYELAPQVRCSGLKSKDEKVWFTAVLSLLTFRSHLLRRHFVV